MESTFCFEKELQEKHEGTARRLFHRIKPLLFEWELSACYIASGCFTDTVNDIDVFPVDTAEFSSVLNRCKDLKTKPIYESKNALTFQCDGIRVQLCNYCYPTLEALVDSFDFAHIQVGAYIRPMHMCSTDSSESCYGIGSLLTYCTDDYKRSLLSRRTWYTLYDVTDPARIERMYPLSSMLRAIKYKERGLMSKSQYATTLIRILYNLLRRGFSDYADFKDQLDAVDLAVITNNPYSPKFKEDDDCDYNQVCMEFEPLMQVYHMLHHNGRIQPASEEEREQLIQEIERYEYTAQGFDID